MTQLKLKTMSLEELVECFTEITTEQDKAIIDEDNGKYNRLFDRMTEIEKELQSRPGDQRKVLVALYNHRNMQVRLMAAQATLELMPIEARPVLAEIADSGCYPQAADARLTLWRLDGTSPVKA